MRIALLVVVMVAGLSPAAHAERNYPWCVVGGNLGAPGECIRNAATVFGFGIRALEHHLRCEPAREVQTAWSAADALIQKLVDPSRK